MRKRYRKIVATIITFLLIAGIPFSVYSLVNSKFLRNNLLGLLAKGGVKIQTDFFNWNPLNSSIVIKGANVLGEKNGLEFKANNIEVRYKILPLLRGHLSIKKLKVDGFSAVIPERTALEGKKPGRLSIKKLFLLQNLEIDEGSVQGVVLDIGEKSTLIADTLTLKFDPKIGGGVGLSVDLQGVSFKGADTSDSLGSLSVSGRTKLTEWINKPPYVNSLDGKIRLQDINLSGIEIASLSGKIKIRDNKFKIEDFDITRDGKNVKGGVEFDSISKKFSGKIEINDPISFPRLGGDDPTIDTSGLITGSVTIDGTGTGVGNASGTVILDLVHEKEEIPPVAIKGDLHFNKGILSLENMALTIGDGSISVRGSVNIPDKKIDLSCEGENIPLESVFKRFGDENFHPIFGTANASATIVGWGKGIHVVGEAATTTRGGYYQIVTDRAHARVDATYQELNLIGEIEQHGKQTGDITLKIKYGTKVPGQPRPKDLSIDANVYNNNLTESFEAYGLTGTGNGRLVIKGPQRSYNGKINAVIENGSFAGIYFEKVSANADMLYKKIKFTSGEFAIPNMNAIAFSSPINMDFVDGGFHLYGTPLQELSFDVDHMARDASWRIKNIKYHGLNVKGTYSPKGSSDLYADGVIDGSSLSVFKQYLREAEGPIEVKLHASGQTNNPSLNGHIVLSKNMIFPRLIYQPLQDVSGRLDFDGHVIKTDSLTGNIEDGPFTVKGFLSHSGQKLEKFDISLVAQNLRYVIEKLKFKTEFNANVRWYGSSANSNLTGDVTILDGKYSKDFVLLENLAGSSKTEDKNKLPFNDDTMHLNLRIRNTGDLTIRNNIGDIWLRTDVTAEGTAAHPLIKGSIEATEGKVHYLGREFIITKGVVEFRAPYAEPYMEVFAEYEVPSIPDLVVNVTLHGWSDNLQLDLSATKPLERRDIISLLLYGVTEADIKQSQFSASMGQSVLWGQVTSMVEGPVTKFSHLDIFRLEASNPDVSTTKKTSSQNMQISRVYMGKRLSDRLSLEFIADINADDAAQTIRAEYLLTDFLLLKGENSASLKYRFAVSLRFRER